MNNVVLTGRLTKEPELRKTTSGLSTVSFDLAVNRDFKKEGQPTADFIKCVAWNKVAENLARFQHKGSMVGVKGKIQTRNYDDQNGRKVYVTEVVAENIEYLDGKNGASASNNTYTTHTNSYSQPSNETYEAIEIQSDYLPF